MASKIEEYTLENPPFAPHNGAGLNGGMVVKQLTWILSTSALLAVSTVGAGEPGSGRKFYEWVDSQGVTHYGDIIPPEYAAQEHRIVNGQGIELEHTEAQKTPEQLAEEDQRRAALAASENRDRNLLNTYVSVQEIERLRDQRLALLSDQIKVTGQFLEVLNVKMGKLRSSISRYKPYSSDPNAPPMTDQLAEDLVRVDSDIRTQQENLREKRSEETIMSKQFESDIQRFKELKGIH
jgi:hypothetical protein